jgi:hypothetical protein
MCVCLSDPFVHSMSSLVTHDEPDVCRTVFGVPPWRFNCEVPGYSAVFTQLGSLRCHQQAGHVSQNTPATFYSLLYVYSAGRFRIQHADESR